MAVLLIDGSTGSGKGTLGSFLIGPTAAQAPFRRVASSNLTVIGTPELNEGKEKDLLHVTDFVESLHEIKSVRACVIVVKCMSKIDQQYKETLQYYSKLLASLFIHNVLVVVTGYRSNEFSKSFEDYAVDTTQQIVESANMSNNPRLFAIDCLPIDEIEKISSLKIGELILSYMLSLQEVSVREVKVVKTKAIEADDKKKVKEYEEKRASCCVMLEEVSLKALLVLNEIREKQMKINDINSNLKYLGDRLKELDSDTEVIAHSYFNGPYHEHKSWRCDYDTVSEWPITSYSKWCDSNSSWAHCDIEKENKYVLRAKLEGKTDSSNSNTRHGELTIYTKKKWMYEDKIKKLELRVSEEKADLKKATIEVEACQEKSSRYNEEIKSLEECITTMYRDIKKLKGNTMTIKQARHRLAALAS